MSLENAVVVITGGASGIGLGTAKVLAARGAQVVLAQRDARRGRAAAKEVAGAVAVELDIRDRAAVERCMRAVVARFGRIDVLVNSASVTGKPALAPFLRTTPAILDRIVDTNLKGTVYCSQAAARHMRRRGRGGSIIHVSSVAAYAAQENASIYCATKAAQAILGQAMAIELAPHGIRVNCVAPGDIATRSLAQTRRELARSGASGRFARFTPLGRRGQPEDVGRAIAFLASDEASFITGATLLVDGGWLAY